MNDKADKSWLKEPGEPAVSAAIDWAVIWGVGIAFGVMFYLGV